MTAPHEPLVVDEVELAPPRRDEVLVRVLASGICRSDLSYMDGKWPIPCPVVLGHEGAGTIEAVGEGVDPGRVGEQVVMTFAPSCGRCRYCLEGRVNLCSEAAACMDAGVLRDGTTRGSRWRGEHGVSPGIRLELRHARGVPGQCGHPDRGRRSRRSRLPARMRRDDGRAVGDPARERAPGRCRRDLRLRRRRALGRAGRAARLGAPGDRRRSAAAQARARARARRHARDRPCARRSGRSRSARSYRAASTTRSRRSATPRSPRRPSLRCATAAPRR